MYNDGARNKPKMEMVILYKWNGNFRANRNGKSEQPPKVVRLLRKISVSFAFQRVRSKTLAKTKATCVVLVTLLVHSYGQERFPFE